MALRLPSHLHRNRHGIFGFRVVIPADLRLSFASREYRVSLRTADRRHAAHAALTLSVFVHQYFLRIRSMPSHADLIAVTSEFLSRLRVEAAKAGEVGAKLEGDELADPALMKMVAAALDERVAGAGIELLALFERQESIVQRKQELARLALTTAMSASERKLDAQFLDLHADLAVANQAQSSLADDINTFLRKLDQTVDEIRHREELIAVVQQAAQEQEMLTDLAARILAKTSVAVPSSPSAAAPTPEDKNVTGPLLEDVIASYCDEQKASWTAKTLAENEAIFALWVRIVGNQPISSYGFEQHREYKKTLQKLPPNINKIPKYKGKTIEQLVKLGAVPAAVNTINKNLTRVASLFKYAVAHGHTGFHPSGMLLKRAKRPNEERDAFSTADLQILFKREEFFKAGAHRQSYMYWTPLIALYTGARQNEVAQLHLDDFRVESGIAVISINETAGDGKRVKTPAGIRIVPIHPELIRLGLLEHVENLRSRKQKRLFPELKMGRDGYGGAVSKWFARFRMRCGVVEPGKVFHSFRHTFINQLKQAGIAKEKISALVGHEDESETFGRYGKSYEPAVLLAVVETLRFDLPPLPVLYPQVRRNSTRAVRQN